MDITMNGIERNAFALMARAHKIMFAKKVPPAMIKDFDQEIHKPEIVKTATRHVTPIMFDRVMRAVAKRFTVFHPGESRQ